MKSASVSMLAMAVVVLLASCGRALSQVNTADQGRGSASRVRMPSSPGLSQPQPPALRLEELIGGSQLKAVASGARQLQSIHSAGSQSSSSALQLAKLSLSIPVYGAWCGPWYSGGKTIDALDECCRQHDLCYGKLNFFSFKNCECDNRIAQCANTFRYLNDGKMSKLQAGMARNIATAFTAAAVLKGCY